MSREVTKVVFDKRGKRFRVKSGGQIALNAGSHLSLASGANIRHPVNTGTTAATFPDEGLTAFGSTAGAKTYNLAPPAAAGIQKFLFCTAATTGTVQTIAVSTGGAVNINGSTSLKQVKFSAVGGVTLVAASTIMWHVFDGSGSTAAVTYA